tara:strand:- start:44 stop:481 length:438 start_codon:yes stop_codon:yes gene_type:complete
MKIIKLNKNLIEKLKKKAFKSKLKRSRICAHKSDKDKIHEMFVCLHNDTYVAPHFHKNKTESYHIIEGKVDIYFFNKKGKVKKKILLNAKSKNQNFYLRLGPNIFHTLVPKTKYVIFHEVTDGPFNKKENKFSQMEIFKKKRFKL